MLKDLVPHYFRKRVQSRLPTLMEKFGDAFLLYCKGGIMETAASLNHAFSVLPVAYQNHFAFKALPEPEIAYFLHKEFGFGLDCSSPAEKMVAMQIGCMPKDIMYSGNRMKEKELDFVLGDGGCLFNFDDITTMDRVKGKFPSTVCFRINPGKRRTGNSIIGNPHDAKYGITYDQIIPAYREAFLRGANHFGIHMMVCSNERHSKYIVETARAILEVAAMLYHELAIKVEFVNIGGGFGIPYKSGDSALNLNWIAKQIRQLFVKFGNEHGFRPKLMTECGRYVTGQHGFLVNRVISVEQKYCRFIGVEAAMGGCPRPAFYGAQHHIEVYSPDGKLRTGPRRYMHVAGPQCENWDRLTADGQPILLPISIQVGDIIVVFNCGAHSAAMAGNYNGRTRLPGVLDQDWTNENTILLRRGETEKDLFRTIMPSPHFTLPGQELSS